MRIARTYGNLTDGRIIKIRLLSDWFLLIIPSMFGLSNSAGWRHTPLDNRVDG